MIVLNDLTTWPTDVISYMERNYEVFLKWETNHKEWSDSEAVEFAGIYDDAVYGLRDVLDAYKLHGYHCTRLQDCEIKTIQSNGMQLPSLRILRGCMKRARATWE